MVIFRARSTSDPNYYYTIESNVDPLLTNENLGPIHYTQADKDCYNSCVAQFNYNGTNWTVGYWVFTSAPTMHKKFYGPYGLIEDTLINNVSGNNLYSGTIASYSSSEPWVANFVSTDGLSIEFSLVQQVTSLTDYMNIILAPTPQQYEWSSVPAISGKNGILSLTEILNINDGNAVNDVALSGNISLSSLSRISAIISVIIQNEGSATVKYSVPSNIYSYIKLVYKQDKIPISVNDGTAVDLDPTATSIDVMGFSKTVGTKYYLVIFTDKSTSDEYSYEVGNPPPRFSIPKKFVSDNGTFNYNIPSWIEDRVLQVLESDPSTTTIYFDVENYPEVANLYSHQFVEYPLQFRTYYGTYPETESRPATSSYIAKDYKLEWLWTSGSAYRDETDYLKINGEWSSVYTQGSGRSRADSNFESFVAEMFILDHIEKKGYPAYFSWAHSENWSGRKYQCQISKMGTGSRYADLATAIYNALK